MGRTKLGLGVLGVALVLGIKEQAAATEDSEILRSIEKSLEVIEFNAEHGPELSPEEYTREMQKEVPYPVDVPYYSMKVDTYTVFGIPLGRITRGCEEPN